MAVVASWGVLIATIALTVTDVMQATGAIDPVYMSEGEASAIIAIAVFYTVAFVLGVIFVAMWIHRAHDNLHKADIEGLEFTPGWAVGWYFIPFANFFKPFQAMRELWNKSTGRIDRDDQVTPGHMGFWWACWVLGNILANISTRMADTTNIDTYEASLVISAISGVFTVIAAVLLIKLIREITEAQSQGFGIGDVFA